MFSIDLKQRIFDWEMDPRIWSRLPEDLLERVLSFLPLKAFFSLRSSCKHFNSLIFSPCFLSRHSSAPFCSFLLLSHPQFHNQFALFDTTLNTWRNFSSSSSLLFSVSCSSSSSPSLLLSISHGLLCFSHPNSSSSFLVCNLLARSSRIVKFPVHPFAFEFLTLVSTPSGYRIFMLSSSSSSSSSSNDAFVYDSRVHLWRQFDRVDSILDDNYLQGGAFYNGCLYFTTPEPFSIVRFDLEIGKWDRPRIELPSGLTFLRLVSDGDKKLYLVGGIGHHGISRSVKLWELGCGDGDGDGDGENWVEIVRVPEMMGRKFTGICYHNYGHVYCFFHQGLICVCCYTWPEILYYKVSRRTWHWLPICPWLPEKWSCGFRWFPLVPELHSYV